VSGLGEHPKKIWDPLLISATVEASNFKFSTQLGFGTSFPKNNVLDQNWRVSGLGEPKNGTPTYFCNRLGLGLACQKTTFSTKIGGDVGQGSIKKNWDPLRIFATVEASNFKFGTQIGFGTSIPKKDV